MFCSSCRAIAQYAVFQQRAFDGVMLARGDDDIYRRLGLIGGIEYDIIRSSGQRDRGWMVVALDPVCSGSVGDGDLDDMPYIIDDEVLLFKVIDGKKCMRRCNLSELVSVNPCMPRDAVAILEREIARLAEEARPAAEALFQQQAIWVDAMGSEVST
jgi:hypothetical protein